MSSKHAIFNHSVFSCNLEKRTLVSFSKTSNCTRPSDSKLNSKPYYYLYKYVQFPVICSLQHSININTVEVDPHSDLLHICIMKPKNYSTYTYGKMKSEICFIHQACETASDKIVFLCCVTSSVIYIYFNGARIRTTEIALFI